MDVPPPRWKVTVTHPADADPFVCVASGPGQMDALSFALHEFSMRTNRNLLEITSSLIERIPGAA